MNTTGKNTSRIAEYIKNQLKEDEVGEQLTISGSSPFTGLQVIVFTQLTARTYAFTRPRRTEGFAGGYLLDGTLRTQMRDNFV